MVTDYNPVVLDQIKNISYVPQLFVIKNMTAVHKLRFGIQLAATNLRNLELSEAARVGATATLIIDDNHINQFVVFNLFNWYSVNLVNFVNSVSLIEFLKIKGVQPEAFPENKHLVAGLKEHRKEYVDSIPELEVVKFFRHKSGAHLAFTDPRMSDNPATLVESLDIRFSFRQGRYVSGMVQRGRGDAMSEFGQKPWSLTENFEQLAARYDWEYLAN